MTLIEKFWHWLPFLNCVFPVPNYRTIHLRLNIEPGNQQHWSSIFRGAVHSLPGALIGHVHNSGCRRRMKCQQHERGSIGLTRINLRAVPWWRIWRNSTKSRSKGGKGEAEFGKWVET